MAALLQVVNSLPSLSFDARVIYCWSEGAKRTIVSIKQAAPNNDQRHT
jgi:hypothetical protein